MRRSLWLVYRIEVLSLLRDVRAMLLTLVLPIVAMPIYIYASAHIERSISRERQARQYRYAVGGDQAEWGRAVMSQVLALARTSHDSDLSALKLVSTDIAPRQPIDAVRHGDVDCYVEAVSPQHSVPRIRLWFRVDLMPSQHAMSAIYKLLRQVRDQRRADRLRDGGFPIPVEQAAVLATTDLATPSQVAASHLGRLLGLFLFTFLLGGAATIATDSIAGERERGTLETILATAANRGEIVAGKLLAVISMGLLTSAVQIGSLLAWIGMGAVPVGLSLQLSPAVAFLIFWMIVPAALLISGVLLLASAVAKSFREAQLYISPIMLIGMGLTLAPLMQTVTLRSPIVLVPLANVSVALRDIVVGQIDWPWLLICWAVTLAAALCVYAGTVAALTDESLVMAAQAEAALFLGGPQLFPFRVTRCFAALWVVLFLSASSGFLTDLRSMVVFNLVGLFLGGSLWMIHHYGLAPRTALALRPVRPAVWLAVLLGAPAGAVLAGGIFRVASWLFPMPEGLLEEFSRTLMPKDVPTWELLVLLALLPAICEEIAFRGVLLYGLRRRLHPLALCLAVGTAFGFFHMDLVRIAPTAFLGTVLSAMTLVTGSIFPGMLWHAMHNGMALLGSGHEGSLEQPAAWAYLVAAAILALAGWIVWRNRTPYPDLRDGRS